MMVKIPTLIFTALTFLLPLASLAAPAPTNARNSSGTRTVIKAQPGEKFTFSDVMAMVAANTSEQAVAKIKASTRIQFSEVHLLNGYSARADVFTPAEQQALVRLGAIIGRNTFLMNELRRAGFLLSDVVAVSILGTDGGALVFVNL